MGLAELSGDLTMKGEVVAASGDLSYSANDWNFGGRRFEVNSFHLSPTGADRDGWCYEFCDVEGPAAAILPGSTGFLPARGPALSRRSRRTGATRRRGVQAAWESRILPKFFQ
jgi:hypothetical protein